MKTIVKNLNTLKAMERKGLIKLNTDTDRFKYVDSSPQAIFEYKGNKYTLTYFSGCFNPYVIQLTFNK